MYPSLSIQNIFHKSYYPYSPSYNKKVVCIGCIIAIIGWTVGVCALQDLIPLNRTVSIIIYICPSLISALVMYLITSAKIYNWAKHRITSVPLHNDQQKSSLKNVCSDLKDQSAAFSCQGFAKTNNLGHASLCTPPINRLRTTFLATYEGATYANIDFFSHQITDFIDLCSKNNRPIWVGFNITCFTQRGELYQEVIVNFFDQA